MSHATGVRESDPEYRPSPAGPFYDVEFFHGHKQFSNELYNEIKATCPEDMLRAKHGEVLSDPCKRLIDRMAEQVSERASIGYSHGGPLL